MIPIMQYGCIPSSEIFSRKNIQADVAAVVTEIIQNVRNRGDEALLEYSLKFDKARLDSLAVTQAEIDEAFASVAPRFLSVLEKAAENIRAYHQKQARVGFESQSPDGIVTGQKILPIAQVGVYVPGGTASYPSTVLMDTIPAVIAGCKRIVMVTPPNPQGKIAPVILAAAKIAGVDRMSCRIIRIFMSTFSFLDRYFLYVLQRLYEMFETATPFVAASTKRFHRQNEHQSSLRHLPSDK